MPIVRTTLIRGYDEAVRRRLSERLTDAVTATLAAPAEATTVVIEEVEPAGYMRGRAAKRPGAARALASERALAFLAAMEKRDLGAARNHLAEGFEMVFPGKTNGTRMTALEDLIAFSAERYRFVKKTIAAVDEAFGKDGTVVVVSGVLSGEDLGGQPFGEVRFIDRFVFEGDLIRRQEVWNDLALVLPR